MKLWLARSMVLILASSSLSFAVAKDGTPTPAKRAGEPTPAKRPETKPPAADSSNLPSDRDEKGGKTMVSTVSNQKKSPTPARRDQESPAQGEKYLLRYQMAPGTKITSVVTHLAKTNTKINDVAQSSQSRTVSRKVWLVKEVAANGDMTFVHQVESVEMSQQIGDGEELRYNSTTDQDPPAVFKQVAESIGKPIATVTITPHGQVVQRSGDAQGANLGMGDITIPMPEEPLMIGDQWETSREIKVRRTDGTPKTVKVRELYTLEKVSAGVAVIAIRSEPLTPLSEPEIEAQALQQMSDGSIRFDLDAGRLISKKLTWDKSVVGFSGPGSMMDYSARLEEVVE